jgi:hypothetical protein
VSDPRSDLTQLPDLRHKPDHGPVRSRRPVYQDLLPPCNNACPAGESQIKGSMSQRHVADPSAFERANYMKILHGWTRDR